MSLILILVNKKYHLQYIVLLLLIITQLANAQEVTTIANVRASGDIAVANNGDLFITDFGNPSLQNGTTVVKLGSDGSDSIFVSNLANAPSGIVIDSTGTVFVATYNGGIIYSISDQGIATQIATANGPVGLALDDQQQLYVAECDINRISRINSGTLTAIASNQGLACPNGLVKGHDGAMYVVNHGNSGMYRVGLTGEVSLFATIPGGGNGHVEYHQGLYYVTARAAHQIYQVDVEGVVSLLAGTGTDGNLDGAALDATFSRPNGLGISPDGSKLYITGNSNFNSATLAIRQIALENSINTDDSIAMNNGLSGTWFNPDTPGQGLLFDINDDSQLFFGAWFTYANPEVMKSIGAPEHRWYTLQGQYNDKLVDIPIFNTMGGVFDDPANTQSEEIGNFMATFSSCNQGRIEYQFTNGNNNVAGGYNITRLTPDKFCESIVNPAPNKIVTMTYVGNDGVYISDGDEGILIDAIGDFGTFFINVPQSLQSEINNVSSPYDKTVAVLVTHGHSDHLNFTPITNFINNTSNAQLFTDTQTRSNFNSLGQKVESINIQRFGTDTRNSGNTTITSISTRHFNIGGNDFSGVDNFVYLVEISGKKILHLGDIDYASDNFQAITGAIGGEIDVVIIPAFGSLVSQQNASLIAQFFPNTQVVAAHLRSGGSLSSDINAISNIYPEAIIFDQPSESIEL